MSEAATFERVDFAASPIAPSHMDTSDFFHSPVDRIAAFAQVQLHLYRQDVRLQDNFLALQTDALAGPRANSGNHRVNNHLHTWAIQSADKLNRLRPRRKIKADVLLCWDPYFCRQTDVVAWSLVSFPMYLDDLFRSPVGRTAAFSKMQQHLHRRDTQFGARL